MPCRPPETTAVAFRGGPPDPRLPRTRGAPAPRNLRPSCDFFPAPSSFLPSPGILKGGDHRDIEYRLHRRRFCNRHPAGGRNLPLPEEKTGDRPDPGSGRGGQGNPGQSRRGIGKDQARGRHHGPGKGLEPQGRVRIPDARKPAENRRNRAPAHQQGREPGTALPGHGTEGARLLPEGTPDLQQGKGARDTGGEDQ